MTVTEEGRCELGWTAAVPSYDNDHGLLWTRLLADLRAYVANLVTVAARR